jgi:hypothetical protein
MCDRETVDAELRANGTLQMLDAEGAFRLAPEDRPTGFAVTRLAVPCCAPGPRCSWLPQMPELQGHPLHPFRLHEGHAGVASTIAVHIDFGTSHGRYRPYTPRRRRPSPRRAADRRPYQCNSLPGAMSGIGLELSPRDWIWANGQPRHARDGRRGDDLPEMRADEADEQQGGDELSREPHRRLSPSRAARRRAAGSWRPWGGGGGLGPRRRRAAVRRLQRVLERVAFVTHPSQGVYDRFGAGHSF